MDLTEMTKYAAGAVMAYSACRYVIAPLITNIREHNRELRSQATRLVYERCRQETLKLRAQTAIQMHKNGNENLQSIAELFPMPDTYLL